MFQRLARRGIERALVVSIVAGCATVLAAQPAVAASGGGASGWHVGYYTPSGRALSFAEASPLSGGVASLDFTSQPDTALLITQHGSDKGSLLGDLTLRTVSATFQVTGLNTGGSFTYYGQPDGCGSPASVRFFFETSNAGGFDETHYWWSNPVSAPLSSLSSPTPLSVQLTGANWSDFYGHFGNDPAYAAGFGAAVANVTAIGLSFGGGCFFENGVGTTDGSGSLNLLSFSVSP
jgi:hypothetical protein